MVGGFDLITGPEDLGLSAAPCEYCRNDRGVKSSEGSCQTSTTRSSALKEVFEFAFIFLFASLVSKSLTRILSGAGECTRAARLLRSRELRLAFGKNDVDGEAGNVRREATEARR